MDDHTGCLPVVAGTGWAVGITAAAGKPISAGGQRAQRIGAPLGDGSGIVVADAVGQLGEALIQHGGVGGKQPAP
ncbi:hypothetical protein L758_20255 [Mycobacterium tuberculosis TRS1]|uniref:Uncharacterized protein n=1 Tax=Mycobacterium tuberculosis TaxID=1773 RepID=A0A066S510_MYCTX|nr:hypothetical protein [Mycobacterium tuberculosis]ALE45276.1 hypothetical protein AA885_19845 [Mycobacterium tuberculosis variant bovis]AQN84570.1 hypothetical protein L766_20210 [Mycobacterium tuberculosis TRS9]AQN88465.1 hypothetical protein L787_20080 [Mycobacterium tuberculosis 1821ADB35]AQN92359.1 hypothetical protein L789_20095 [Mycobacterium tuberculosis 1821ADB37]AQN96247.1 hypothetical protein L790_20210 [Mycobacterium tuberculosis 1821ADB38]AQO00129.1 hypothetical protein L792_200